MDQLRHRQRLAAEAGDEALVVGEVLGEDLHRDGPLEDQVGRLVDVRHAAGAEPLARLVAAGESSRLHHSLPAGSPGPTPPEGVAAGFGRRRFFFGFFVAFGFAFGLRWQGRRRRFFRRFFDFLFRLRLHRLFRLLLLFHCFRFFGCVRSPARFLLLPALLRSSATTSLSRVAPSRRACFSFLSTPPRSSIWVLTSCAASSAPTQSPAVASSCTWSRLEVISLAVSPGSRSALLAAAAGAQSQRRDGAEGEGERGMRSSDP